MKVSIRNLEKRLSMILPLAEAYQRSYNKLSADYKSESEMALYTKGYFVKKLWKMAEDDRSTVAVLHLNDVPRGFIRYSAIPEYYTQPENGRAQDVEKGYLDGFEYAWCRKVNFEREVALDDKTLIVNQIYLDPQIQHHGLGTLLFQQTVPELKKQGFESLIIEYNANNTNAKDFYQKLGFVPFAQTKDFDHILKEDGRTVFCISDVRIAHTTIDNALEHLRRRQQMKQTLITVIDQRKHGRAY